MSVLVTGGAGFIGSHVVDALLAAGAAVRVLDNLHPAAHAGEPAYLDARAEWLHGDLRDADAAQRAACLAGLLAAPAGALLVFLDADGSDDPAALRRLAQPVLDGEADLVLGSRVRGRREPGALAPHQLAANRAIAALIRARWRVPISDIGPMRAIRREALLALRMRSRTHGWPVEMLVKAARRGLRVEELPVDTRARAGGRSKVAGSLSGSLKAGVRLLAALVRYGLGPTR